MIQFRSLSDEDEELLDKAARAISAKRILEIGARLGDSSVILGKVSKDNDGMLYTIEGDPQKMWKDRMKEEGLSNYSVLVKGWTPWIDYGILPREIDLLLIDGDHRTSRAISDFHFFQPMVREGGLVAFHDTVFEEERCGFMVTRAIDIILEEYPNYEDYSKCGGEFGTRIIRKIRLQS